MPQKSSLMSMSCWYLHLFSYNTHHCSIKLKSILHLEFVVKSTLQNLELGVCRGVISVCLESPFPLRIQIFDWDILLFQICFFLQLTLKKKTKSPGFYRLPLPVAVHKMKPPRKSRQIQMSQIAIENYHEKWIWSKYWGWSWWTTVKFSGHNPLPLTICWHLVFWLQDLPL